ncbi:MAG: tetratricopeptide repeat protein [Candidatus Eisenbacteria bacterium]
MKQWNRTKAVLPLAALLLVGWGDPVREETARGVKAYEERRFEEALASFLRAEREAPERPLLSFNVGAALYQTGRFDEALAAYHGSREAPETAAASLYGAGNALFRTGRLAEAAELYKQALRRDPRDEDAKHNLELVQKKLEEMESQQQQQSGEDDQDRRENREKQERSEQEEDRESPPEEEKQPNPSRENEEPPPPDEPEQGETPPSPGEMSREEAERILDALAEEEENLRRESIERRRTKRKASAKDW